MTSNAENILLEHLEKTKNTRIRKRYPWRHNYFINSKDCSGLYEVSTICRNKMLETHSIRIKCLYTVIYF